MLAKIDATGLYPYVIRTSEKVKFRLDAPVYKNGILSPQLKSSNSQYLNTTSGEPFPQCGLGRLSHLSSEYMCSSRYPKVRSSGLIRPRRFALIGSRQTRHSGPPGSSALSAPPFNGSGRRTSGNHSLAWQTCRNEVITMYLFSRLYIHGVLCLLTRGEFDVCPLLLGTSYQHGRVPLSGGRWLHRSTHAVAVWLDISCLPNVPTNCAAHFNLRQKAELADAKSYIAPDSRS